MLHWPLTSPGQSFCFLILEQIALRIRPVQVLVDFLITNIQVVKCSCNAEGVSFAFVYRGVFV
jgi:hypothetical protein